MSVGMWGFTVALMVAICAVLAATGFKGRVTIVGIDLGTTYSVVGVNENGAVRIIRNKEGSYLVPSMVTFLDSGDIAVGHAAQEHVGNMSHITIYEAKRLIGRAFESDKLIAEQAPGRPYDILRSPSNADESDAWFDLRRLSNHLPYVSPRHIGSLIIQELIQLASSDLGHSQIRQVVIAVPAKFDALQRAATVGAFKDAGLKVVRVLEEPTAAALAYGLQHRPDIHYILVYDFGGGTLDVSLLYVSDGNVEVIATDGDDTLGGGDFDRVIASLAMKIADPHSHMDQNTIRMPSHCLFSEPICALHALRDESERVKQSLSFNQSDVVKCRMPVLSQRMHNDECESWVVKEALITRQEFEKASEHIFSKAINVVDRLMKSSGHSADEIDEVVMVGGSSRIPKIREDLKKKLGKSHLNTHIDPDVTVAYGTATVAH